MASKFTFTYEFIPEQYDPNSKLTSAVVLENAEELHKVLENFKNFLTTAGFCFDSDERLDLVKDDFGIPSQEQKEVKEE